MRIDAVFGAIGRFAVRFRWLVVLAWIAAAIAAATQLPALSSAGAVPAGSVQPGPLP
jgi:uncharacterized membrane protein YdfJ with MMPL/SSD domain